MRNVSWSLVLLALTNPTFVHATDDARSVAEHKETVERGSYLVSIMDCTGCHTGGALRGAPDSERYLAGSEIGFATAKLIVYPPNLTPDAETGLGRWSDAQIIAAIRMGQGPDGRMLSPVMPWPSYSRLSDEDARAIVAYLRSIRSVSFTAPAPVAEGQAPTDPYLTLAFPESR